MRSRLIAPLAMALMMALPLGAAPLTAAAQQLKPLDHIVAVVNEGAIMYSELESRVARVRDQLSQRGVTPPSDAALEQQVLDRMIVEEIQLQMARDANLSVDDTELNRTVRSVAENNGMSLEAFADTLEADGLSLAAVREDVRRELLMRQLQQRRVASRVTVSEREVDRYLEQQGANDGVRYRLAHIMVALPQSPSQAQIDDARDKIEDLRRQLENGADFASLAAAESDGGQALNGGDLGWRAAAEIPSIFTNAVPSLDVGEVSEPIRSPSGFHLVKLSDREGGQGRNLTQRDQVRQTLFQRKANDEMEVWLQEIRADAYIDNRLNESGAS
ncbi:periplasmic chaperone for outer membrane proteins SurA [Onishia taeanensis]|jgi:peptidyl-prolyl cis-trans isomerase SurA|uniref:Periplasmic chaperone for outer membrane proteins SurA n=1 Tax=Onishia taeanensis TaxID=284577 RepID=A0A1G7PH09_9GAMM|nr:peptidylprolyl isomerase [Halomonas taeanensis]MAX33987.1 peptidylprolyl isomerase [Halomonadaceae bacterium]SDF85642.1 periplasmic chaperone for outer membrane proteins SurA [Halomonas taeanensis]